MIDYLDNEYDFYNESDDDDVSFISNEVLIDLLYKDNRKYIQTYFINSKSPNPKITSANKNNNPIKMDYIINNFYKKSVDIPVKDIPVKDIPVKDIPVKDYESDHSSDSESDSESDNYLKSDNQPLFLINKTTIVNKDDNWTEPKYVKNNLLRNRNKAFNILSDKNNLKIKLYRKKYCNSLKTGIKCNLSNCNYAHNKKELNKLLCAFGNYCKYVCHDNNYIYTNKSKSQICSFQHINETDENFYNRISMDCMEKELNIKKYKL